MMEQVLKWSSIASLCALLITLAIQLKPRLVERAEADPYANEETVLDSKQPLVHRIAAPDHQGEDEEGKNTRKEDASRQDKDERLPEARPVNRLERRDSDSDDESEERGETERFDVQREDLTERHEALREDEEPRFDVQQQDLPERHEALIPDEGSGAVERFNTKEADLPERHEALISDDDEPGAVERFDTKEADLPERHQALAEKEKNEDEADVNYHLIPVPQNESTKE